jgi:hypothetical protein
VSLIDRILKFSRGNHRFWVSCMFVSLFFRVRDTDWQNQWINSEERGSNSLERRRIFTKVRFADTEFCGVFEGVLLLQSPERNNFREELFCCYIIEVGLMNGEESKSLKILMHQLFQKLILDFCFRKQGNPSLQYSVQSIPSFLHDKVFTDQNSRFFIGYHSLRCTCRHFRYKVCVIHSNTLSKHATKLLKRG